jgi:hypothetical protein
MRAKAVVEIADAATDPGYVERRPEMVAAVELGGVGTMLGVPMLKESDLLGVFALNRQEVCPFNEKQIAHELRRSSRYRHREREAAQRTAPANN